MQEISAVTIPVSIKRYSGKSPVLVVDPATGRNHKFKSSSKDRLVQCSASQTLLVGTDAEIEAEKTKADAKYAPIKAAWDAAKAATPVT